MVKKIHYIWLGGKKKPRTIQNCINSWKKYMPGWEIIEWNENNVNLDINKFCRDAYDAKKYAFAADVLRFSILLEYGGMYLDTDVRMLKSMEPLVEKEEGFTGYEHTGKINPGLVLYVPYPGNTIIKTVLEEYNNTQFKNFDGTLNLRVVGDYFEDVIKNYGELDPNASELFGDIRIYTTTYFCPRDGLCSIMNYSENTYSEHLYAASWKSPKYLLITSIKRCFYRTFGADFIKKSRNKLKSKGLWYN